MRSNSGERDPWLRVRWAAAIAGGVLIAIAFVADHLGIGHAGSVGIGQLLLASAGVALVAAGWLGRHFVGAYTGLSILLLNTPILLGMIEVGLARWSDHLGLSGAAAR